MWWTALRIQQVCNITSTNPCPAGFLSLASVNKEIIKYFIRIFEKSLKPRVLGAFLYALLYEDFVKI